MDTLEKRVDHLQYEELEAVKEDITEIKMELSTNSLLTRQSIDASNKLSDTMDSLKNTMVEITQSVKDSNRINSELAITVKNLNDKVDNVENKMSERFEEYDEKIDCIDSKSKLDILTFLTKHWFSAVLGLGALGYAISLLVKG